MSKTKKAALAGSGVLVAAALFAAWWLGFFGWSDPAVAELQREVDRALAAGEMPDREALRPKVEQLSESQRRAFFMRNMPRIMNARMTAMMNMPREEFDQMISERADRIIANRRQGGGADRGGPPGGGPGRGGPGGRGFADLSPSERMKRISDFTTPEMRAGVSEMMNAVNQELESRGEKPMESPREMFRAGGPPGGRRGGRSA